MIKVHTLLTWLHPYTATTHQGRASGGGESGSEEAKNKDITNQKCELLFVSLRGAVCASPAHVFVTNGWIGTMSQLRRA